MVDFLMWGAADAPGSALLGLHLCCEGALGLPPLGPAILEPDLRTRVHGAPNGSLKITE